jgi:hypothetical protein
MLKFNRNFLFTALFFLYPLILFQTFPVRTFDLGIWTALGAQSIKAGHLVVQDTFSLLSTLKMIYPSWGLSLVYGAIFLNSGEWFIAGLRLFHLGVLLLFLAIVYKKYFHPLQNRWHFKNLIFVLLFFYGGNILFVDRPSLVAMIPALLAFDIIHGSNKIDFSKIKKLFFITLIWINMHASAVLVLIMLVFKLVMSAILSKVGLPLKIDVKSYLLALVVSLVALLINPFGWNIFPYVVQTAMLSHSRFFLEWLSPVYFEDAFHSTLFFLWVGFLISFLYKSIKKKNYDLLISPYILLTLMGLVSLRDTVWTYFFIFPIFIQEGRTVEAATHEQTRWLNTLLVLALVTNFIILNPFMRPKFLNALGEGNYDLSANVPETEVEMILKSQNQGPIFDAMAAGYLVLRVPNKIFVDARNIIYSHQSQAEYDIVVNAKNGWDQILDKYKFEFVLLDKRYVTPKLIEELSQSRKWKQMSSRRNFFLVQRESFFGF